MSSRPCAERTLPSPVRVFSGVSSRPSPEALMTGVPPNGQHGPHVLVDSVEVPVVADDDRHHLGRVLRLRNGDSMTVGDGPGAGGLAVGGRRSSRPVTSSKCRRRLRGSVSRR